MRTTAPEPPFSVPPPRSMLPPVTVFSTTALVPPVAVLFVVSNATLPAPITTPSRLTAEPVVVVMVFWFAPAVTLMVPPPVALKPVPAPLLMASPPPRKLTVAPPLPASETAVTPLALVLMVLVAPLKLITAVPLLPLTSMPPPCALDDRLPLKLTVPAVRPVTSIRSPAVVFATDALIVMAAVPPLILTPIPPGSLLSPIEPPLMMIAPLVPEMSIPSPPVPLIATLPSVTVPAELAITRPSPVELLMVMAPVTVSEPVIWSRITPLVPPPAVRLSKVALNAIGSIDSAVPLFDVIWLPATLAMLTVPELCARNPNAPVPFTVMSTPPLKS